MIFLPLLSKLSFKVIETYSAAVPPRVRERLYVEVYFPMPECSQVNVIRTYFDFSIIKAHQTLIVLSCFDHLKMQEKGIKLSSLELKVENIFCLGNNMPLSVIS